jgi:hypothetical protein
MGCTPMRHTHEMHVAEVHAHDTHTCKVHAREMHAREVHAYEMHAYEVHVYETHTYQMHAHQMRDRLTVTNRPRFGCDSQARTPNRKPGLRLINTQSLGQNPYLDSLGIGGGEVDGTAVMEGWTGSSGMPYITLSSKEYSRLPELCPPPISRPTVSPDTSLRAIIREMQTW